MQNESKVDLSQTCSTLQTRIFPGFVLPLPVSEPPARAAGLPLAEGSSLGWGGDKAHYSSATVIWKVLCQRRSGAVSGLRGRLEGSGPRIPPAARSESQLFPTTLTRDTCTTTQQNILQHRQHYDLRGQRAGRTGWPVVAVGGHLKHIH